MTETLSQPSISELEQGIWESSRLERELALETDAMPQKIQQAAHQDARSKARAAREGRAGAAVAAVEQESEVPSLRQ